MVRPSSFVMVVTITPGMILVQPGTVCHGNFAFGARTFEKTVRGEKRRSRAKKDA